MRKVGRIEILDYVTYSEKRDQIRVNCLKEKNKRRVSLGENLTFLFENKDTVRYQIQEMMRIERIIKEEAILHEMATYNNLLGDKGELGCTLLIAFDDPNERRIKLTELIDLPKHIFLEFADKSKSYARFDANQVGDLKLSAVQFLKFKCPSRPIKLGCDHPLMNNIVNLTEEQKEILQQDLMI